MRVSKIQNKPSQIMNSRRYSKHQLDSNLYSNVNNASSSNRPLGQLRVTGKAAEPPLVKLPPVEIYPSRSFEDTFIRGLQVGKPALVNIATQVNQAQILNATAESALARPTPNSRILPPTEHKAINARASYSPVFGQEGGFGGEESKFWEEEVMEMRNHIQELLDEIDEFKDKDVVQKEELGTLKDTLIQEQESNRQACAKLEKLENDYEEMVNKYIEENEKLEAAQERLNELVPLEAEVEKLRRDNGEMRHQLENNEAILQQKMQQLEEKHEEHIKQVRLDIEKEMFAKDDKIAKLKRTLEAMMGQKSTERQKQLDDMAKNFAKLQEECEVLKAKLKHYEQRSKISCQNCGRLTYKLEEKMSKLQTKEHQVLQYQEQNNHLRSQLVEQDRDMDKIIKERAIETVTIYKY